VSENKDEIPDVHFPPAQPVQHEIPGEEMELPLPEDFLPTPKPPLSEFERMPRKGSLLPGAIFFAMMTAVSILKWSDPERFYYFDVTKASITESHQYWRLITAIFGHGNLDHLMHNLPIYLFFAWLLQGYFGLLASVVLPLIIGVLSNGWTIYFYDENVHLLGASGMIFGMVALWLVLYVRFDRGNWWVKRVMRAVGFTMLVLFPQTYDPKVSYLAHLSGFICGVILGVLFAPVISAYAPVNLTSTHNHNVGVTDA
jgi:membrane associated rhomboid family serine protease